MFNPVKSIIKGLKGAAVGVIGAIPAVLSIGRPTAETISPDLADSLAQAISEGDQKRASYFLLAAVFGFVIEFGRNFIKHRNK